MATVGDLGGLPIEDFAEKLFRRFGIGAAGKDNGLLLLCSRDDRALRLEVGYGLESVIPDARACRLLEINGLPYLRQGLFGRGLFLAVREIASAAAAAQGVTLVVAEPAPWPGQVMPPAPLARPAPKKKASWDPCCASLYFAFGLLVVGASGSSPGLLRAFGKARGKAARAKAAGGAGPIAMAWSAGVAGFFLSWFRQGLPAAFVAMIVVPGLATAGQLLLGRPCRRRLSSYRLPCAKCDAADGDGRRQPG